MTAAAQNLSIQTETIIKPKTCVQKKNKIKIKLQENPTV